MRYQVTCASFDEGMVEVALRMPYSEAKEFAWQAAALLKKPKEGWSFSDPARHPLATDDEVVYGDPAFWASKRQRFLKEEERLEEVKRIEFREEHKRPVNRDRNKDGGRTGEARRA